MCVRLRWQVGADVISIPSDAPPVEKTPINLWGLPMSASIMMAGLTGHGVEHSPVAVTSGGRHSLPVPSQHASQSLLNSSRDHALPHLYPAHIHHFSLSPPTLTHAPAPHAPPTQTRSHTPHTPAPAILSFPVGLPPMYSEMKKPSDFDKTLYTSFGIMFLIYAYVGVCGYILFGDDSNVLVTTDMSNAAHDVGSKVCSGLWQPPHFGPSDHGTRTCCHLSHSACSPSSELRLLLAPVSPFSCWSTWC